MANIVATNSDTAIFLSTGDNLYVPDAVAMINTNLASRGSTDAINLFSQSNAFVDGDVVSLQGDAITAGSDEGSNGFNVVTIGTTGKVRGMGEFGVHVFGNYNTFINFGEVFGADAGLRFRHGSNLEADNHGILSGVDFGVRFFSCDFSLTNTGEISGGYGVFLSTTEGTITNSGQITASEAGGNGIRAGISLGAITVINSGEITAPNIAILLDDYADELTNSGEIIGDVVMGNGGDVVNNSGTIVGLLDLGFGDDFYSGRTGGVVTGQIDMGDGNDYARGGRFADDVLGGQGADEIEGFGGDDVLRGGTEDDIVRGGSGNDSVAGGDGNDRVNGGAGEDLINGGLGKDIQTGGTGVDTFRFIRTYDSLAGADRDRIRDFEVGIDKIDLVEIGGLTFIGENAFSNAPEVRIFVRNGATQVDVDKDADGIAEMRITLNAATGLTESDFLL